MIDFGKNDQYMQIWDDGELWFGGLDVCSFIMIWLFLNYALLTSELLHYQDRHYSLRIIFKRKML